MTWQRIDENTYIDDTLVTCAEYQLFIDEMREQGKYYQPDHWTLHQFLKGQAREPILGVRYSDTIEFFKWLTYREPGEWGYRLPLEKEVRIFPIINQSGISIGYWLDGKIRFSWAGIVSDDPRKIKDLAFDVQTSAITSTRNPLRKRELNKAHVRAKKHANARGIVLDLEKIVFKDVDFDYEHALDRANILDAEQRIEMIDRALPRIFYRVDDLDLAFALYIDIFTLRERIAGRSPAFEGIRLVKERIR